MEEKMEIVDGSFMAALQGEITAGRWTRWSAERDPLKHEIAIVATLPCSCERRFSVTDERLRRAASPRMAIKASETEGGLDRAAGCDLSHIAPSGFTAGGSFVVSGAIDENLGKTIAIRVVPGVGPVLTDYEAPAPADAVIANGLVDVRPPEPFTVFGKIVHCTRCNASPLSAQEFQNGWLCHACAQKQPLPGLTIKTDPTLEPDEWRVEQAPRRECSLCSVDLTSRGLVRHSILFPAGTEVIVTCTGERCMAWAERVREQVEAMRVRMMEVDASSVPVGKAPQCGHQAITEGCLVCAVLRDRMVLVDRQRAARTQMAEMGALGPADADDLRRQFGLPVSVSPPIIHINNHYDADPGLVNAFASEAGQKAVMNVMHGNPIRRRAEEISAERATGYADRSYAERAAMLLYDEVNGIGDARPPRPDGFSQAQVDAAKAVLLAPVVKRGGK